MSYDSFSSLPPEEDQQFVVFEQRTVESSKKAQTIGWAVAGGVLLFVLITVFSNWGTLHKPSEEEPAEEEHAAAAPTPPPAPLPTPAAVPTPPPAPAAA